MGTKMSVVGTCGFMLKRRVWLQHVLDTHEGFGLNIFYEKNSDYKRVAGNMFTFWE